MQTTDTATQVVDTVSFIDRLVQSLGFHDVTSFVVVLIFIVLALSFVVSGFIFLKRKRKERLEELNKIVKEVQKAALSEEIPEAVSMKSEQAKKLKAQLIEEKISKVRAKEAVLEPKKTVEEKIPEKKTVVRPPVSVREAPKPEAFKPLKEKPQPKEEPKVELKKELPPVLVEERAPVVETEPPVIHHEEPVLKPAKKPLGAALKNTRGGFMQKLARLFSGSHDISDDDFEAMEAILFTADIGVKTAQKLLDTVRDRVHSAKNASPQFLREALKEEMRALFATAPAPAHAPAGNPSVIMFVGVNGAGKTTSIGKLGAQLKAQGKSVFFGAGDTFRAAAVKQLCIWGERAGIPVVSGKENSDSASVLFDAIDQAKKAQADVVLCDTAGRLHTKSDLMEELKKVHRVVNKAHQGAPHEVFLVVDATMGQNAIMQAREFAEITPLTGIVLSKLDGTAKGGVALGIVDELKVPIRYVGIGEQIDDLREFDADQFIEALFEEQSEGVYA